MRILSLILTLVACLGTSPANASLWSKCAEILTGKNSAPARLNYEFKTRTGSISISRITPEEFNHLAPGTALVDIHDHRVHLVGYHFFNLQDVSEEGFLRYGFSSAIQEQPFAQHRLIMLRDLNWLYKTDPSKYSATQFNYGHFNAFDMPPAVLNYLKLCSNNWSGQGERWDVELTGRVKLSLYFSYGPDQGLDPRKTFVHHLSLFLGWNTSGNVANSRFARAAKRVGLPAPSNRHPFIEIHSRHLMEEFFQQLTLIDGGLEKLIQDYNASKAWYGNRDPDFSRELQSFLNTYSNQWLK